MTVVFWKKKLRSLFRCATDAKAVCPSKGHGQVMPARTLLSTVATPGALGTILLGFIITLHTASALGSHCVRERARTIRHPC